MLGLSTKKRDDVCVSRIRVPSKWMFAAVSLLLRSVNRDTKPTLPPPGLKAMPPTKNWRSVVAMTGSLAAS